MPYSLKLVLAFLAMGALATPVSLYVQRQQNQGQAKIMAQVSTGGDPDRGRRAALRDGCGACHTLPGVSGAAGEVGPELKAITQRAEIAGVLTNDPASLMAWIRRPQQVRPGVGMPEMNLPEADIRDIAAYLYTIRGA
jgi:cytochrome c2